MFQTAHLSPEQNKAVALLEQAMRNIQGNTISMPLFTLDKVTNTGDMFFVNGIIKTPKIPRAGTWIWNQSRGRQEFCCPQSDIDVCFFKLNTRSSRKHKSTPPPYKLWVFNVYMKRENREITWFWCEKGSEISKLDQHLLSDLSFLEPFVDTSFAIEIGWEPDFQPMLDVQDIFSVSDFAWLNDF